MTKLLLAILFLLLTTTYNLQPIYARTTPEDILNDRWATYNAQIKNYSPDNQKKLTDFQKKIQDLNKQETDRLEAIMIRQGEILDEYIYRNKIDEPLEDGKARNLSDPVENARYWLTYAHEAVAYQAIQVYIFNLNGQANIKTDVNAQVNKLAADMNILEGKVDKSQKIIETLVSK